MSHILNIILYISYLLGEKMDKNIKLQETLEEIGQIMGIKKQEIKNTLKQRKNSIITGIIFLLALAIFGNLKMLLGSMYITVSPTDFNLFNNFPFSWLF
jgi:hypothetical protein